jgi:hypothetical protein
VWNQNRRWILINLLVFDNVTMSCQSAVIQLTLRLAVREFNGGKGDRQERTLHQRIPVPISMWNRLQRSGAHMHVIGTGLLQIQNKRAAVLICYEQLLVWPLIGTLFAEPIPYFLPPPIFIGQRER